MAKAVQWGIFLWRMIMECFVCERIDWIKDGKNPYFVRELETGYVVLGDHQRFRGNTVFLCKRMPRSCTSWNQPFA